jgi:RNA polymerase sigma-70 factor (ECF subfamily)
MELTRLDDGVLVERARAGDREAFRTLVERHMRKVYAVAFDMTGNHHDAEDISQDVFLRTFQALARFRSEAKVSTWLYRTTVNACIDRRRRKAWRISSGRGSEDEHCAADELSGSSGALSDPETATETALLQQHLGKALDGLPPRQRAVFVLRHYHDLPLKEIAQCLQVTEGTVKNTLFKAIRRLRTKLNRYGYHV